ncbi:MAG: EF-hand domain-containing protein [Planctomycetota bacterium]
MAGCRRLCRSFVLLAALLPLAQEAQEDGVLPTPAELEAERAAAAERRREEERRAHFRICDADRNGWLSFREAEFALHLDREEFRRYDADADGRIDPTEFAARYAEVLALVGGLPVLRAELQDRLWEPPPLTLTPIDPGGAEGMVPTAPDLLVAYDRSGDEALDQDELELLLGALGAKVDVEVVLAGMDVDQTRTLVLAEIEPLAGLVADYLRARPDARGLDDRDAFLRLFSSPRSRLAGERTIPGPPHIPGPVTHFRRLDLDDDGFVDARDLALLLAPARIPIRTSAVLAALDRDGDSRLDETEFLAAMGASRARRPNEPPRGGSTR